jgi:nitronate monooxygenase
MSFHFGVDQATVAKVHTGGAKVLCSATTVAEAVMLEAAGVDAVIAQGSEAGGHRGTFDGDYQQALIGTMALVPQIVDAVAIPVIAAGGVMDARGLVACLALGACAVQMGTAFLGCHEAPIGDEWRQALHAASAEDIVVTKVMSGRPARGIRNRYIDELEQLEEPLLPYPAQYSISRKLRQLAAAKPSFGAHWAGQGVGMFRDITVAELMSELIENTAVLTKKLAHL